MRATPFCTETLVARTRTHSARSRAAPRSASAGSGIGP